jgi:uncharacterized membrane protein (DUF485 family)
MNLNDFIDKNDPGPIMKIMFLVQGLAYFTLFTSIGSFIGWIASIGTANAILCGQFLGVLIISLLILIWIMTVIISIIPKDLLDEIYKNIEDELNRKKEEKKKRKIKKK